MILLFPQEPDSNRKLGDGADCDDGGSAGGASADPELLPWPPGLYLLFHYGGLPVLASEGKNRHLSG